MGDIQLGDPYFEGSEETFGGGEPKPGDHGTCARCGDEIVLEIKINLLPGTPVEALEWEHVDRLVSKGLRDHMAVLGGPA